MADTSVTPPPVSDSPPPGHGDIWVTPPSVAGFGVDALLFVETENEQLEEAIRAAEELMEDHRVSEEAAWHQTRSTWIRGALQRQTELMRRPTSNSSLPPPSYGPPPEKVITATVSAHSALPPIVAPPRPPAASGLPRFRRRHIQRQTKIPSVVPAMQSIAQQGPPTKKPTRPTAAALLTMPPLKRLLHQQKTDLIAGDALFAGYQKMLKKVFDEAAAERRPMGLFIGSCEEQRGTGATEELGEYPTRGADNC
eukprot:NODE_193_length_1939_cov_69.408389_g169_i0.p1 GENE.NODE_193_length_1939_cov_69.408389_g169_i0~~NODE_193_length_1939_cov_69.408389_g169_i0.p1  ORF type:complete len:253 (+),score=30.32 NODE_193_length_1939_cov_69.408389_g169_i0:108-866(+)